MKQLYKLMDDLDTANEIMDIKERNKYVDDYLRKFEVSDKDAATLIAVLRVPYSYHRQLTAYKETFERVFTELVSRGRDAEQDLNGLPCWEIMRNPWELKTYSARAECFHDVARFLSKPIGFGYVNIKPQVASGINLPDVTIEFQAVASLNLIKAYLRNMIDCHVFLETIRPVALSENSLERVRDGE